MLSLHINVPYPMLLQRTEFAIANRIHPEIYFSADDLDTCRDKDAQRLAETLRQSGLGTTIHGPFMDLSPGGVDRRVKEVTLDRFLRTVELGILFKPKAIVFHPGYEKWKFNGNVNLWLESSLETWKPLVKRAEGLGLTLAIENVFEESPNPLVSLLKGVNSPRFRFCFDTGHHHVFAKTPLSGWLEALREFLVECHLHDNHKEIDEHLPIGEGGFDFDAFFAILSLLKLNPIYTLEPHQEDHLNRTLKAARRYIPLE